MLTLLVSSRVDPSLSRLVGRQTPLLLPLRQPQRRAVLLHPHGQQRLVILQRGTPKGVLRPEGATGPAMEPGRAALRHHRPTVVMSSRSLSEGWWRA